MPTSTRHIAVAASAAFTLASVSLAGCTTGSNATITHNPPLSTFGGKSTARSGVQTAILAASVSTGLAVPGGPTPASIARHFLSLSSARRTSVNGTSTGACTNGSKTSTVGPKTDGSFDTTTDLYYEATCVTLESEEVVNDTKPGQTTDSGTGTITTYDKSGNVTSFHSLTLTLVPTTGTAGSETITVKDNYAASNGGTALGASGATCVGAPNSATMTCSAAQAGIASAQGFGQSLTLSGTAGTGGAKNTVQISVAYFDGNGLAISQPTTTTWGVSGAGSFNTATGTYGYTTTGATGSGTLALADTVYTYTETATLSATGLSVTIVRGTDPIATAVIDAAGNGTITYADGTTDVVAAGLVGA
jgi:hypothetical protein